VGSGIDVTATTFYLGTEPAWTGDAPATGWTGARAPIAGGYSYSLHRTAPLVLYTSYTLHAHVADVYGNTTDDSWSFRTVDNVAPVISDESPVPDAVSVGLDTAIKFDVKDIGSGVDTSATTVYLGDELAWSSDTPAAGWTGGCTPITGGCSYLLYRTAKLDPFTYYTLHVRAADLDGNTASADWTFQTDPPMLPGTKVYAISRLGKAVYERTDIEWQLFAYQPALKGYGGLILSSSTGQLMIYDDGGIPWEECIVDCLVTGSSFSMTEDCAVMGVPGTTGGGRFQVYQRSGVNTWAWLRTVANPNSPDADQFGAAVSVSDDTITAHAPTYNEGGHSGAVYVYVDYGATLQQTITLSGSSPPPTWLNVFLEGLVGVVGDKLLIWVKWTNEFDTSYTLSLYERTSGVWTATQALISGEWEYDVGVMANNWDGNRLIELHTIGATPIAAIYSPAWATQKVITSDRKSVV
jgi:hypothetical protein